MTRDDSELWELVDYDPVCQLLLTVRDALTGSYPHYIADAAVRLREMVLSETYDRLARREGSYGLQGMQGKQD